jgi:hypothetical protein
MADAGDSGVAAAWYSLLEPPAAGDTPAIDAEEEEQGPSPAVQEPAEEAPTTDDRGSAEPIIVSEETDSNGDDEDEEDDDDVQWIGDSSDADGDAVERAELAPAAELLVAPHPIKRPSSPSSDSAVQQDAKRARADSDSPRPADGAASGCRACAAGR